MPNCAKMPVLAHEAQEGIWITCLGWQVEHNAEGVAKGHVEAFHNSHEMPTFKQAKGFYIVYA